jgi:hypothetical protein
MKNGQELKLSEQGKQQFANYKWSLGRFWYDRPHHKDPDLIMVKVEGEKGRVTAFAKWFFEQNERPPLP